MSGSSTIRGSPLPYEEEPYPGDKVNPVDVCSASAGSALLSIHDTVDRVNLYRNISIFFRGNLRLRDPSASSHKRTSPSSFFCRLYEGGQKISQKAMQQPRRRCGHLSRSSNRKAGKGRWSFLMSIQQMQYGFHEDQRPTRHFNALRAQCPAPYCLFKDRGLTLSWNTAGMIIA